MLLFVYVLQNVQVLQLAYLLGNFSTSLQICHEGQIITGIIHVFIPIDQHPAALDENSLTIALSFQCLSFISNMAI